MPVRAFGPERRADLLRVADDARTSGMLAKVCGFGLAPRSPSPRFSPRTLALEPPNRLARLPHRFGVTGRC